MMYGKGESCHLIGGELSLPCTGSVWAFSPLAAGILHVKVSLEEINVKVLMDSFQERLHTGIHKKGEQEQIPAPPRGNLKT